MKKCLVLGPGQDGSYLVDALLARGDSVHVFYRHSSCDNLWRIRHCLDLVTLHRGDMVDAGSLYRTLATVKPDEIYNVADQDNIGWSKEVAYYQRLVTYDAVDLMFGYIEDHLKECRIYQPLSVTIFGDAPPPQSESTPVANDWQLAPYPKNKSRLWTRCRRFRDRGLHVSCAILGNHDSERRNSGYLLQSICQQAVAVSRGQKDAIVVGSLDQGVDIGYAPDYMEAAMLMLQQDKPDDYVIGTGQALTIGEMCDIALRHAGVSDPEREHVKVDSSLISGGPQPVYICDPTKAKNVLGWSAKHSADDVIRRLISKFKAESCSPGKSQ